MAGVLNLSKADLERLKTAYRRAVDAGETQFTFDGHELVVSYAKYLIEYVEGQLKRKKR